MTSSELALPGGSAIEFDAYASDLAEYNDCKKALDYWKARQETVRKRLIQALGENAEAGVIDGREVFSYRAKNSLNKSALEKARPDLWAAFQREVKKFEFDEDVFRHAMPDVWEEFRIKAVKVDFHG